MREFHSDKCLLPERRKSQISTLSLHFEKLKNKRTNLAQISRRKEITNIRAEISETETEKSIKKSNETKS